MTIHSVEEFNSIIREQSAAFGFKTEQMNYSRFLDIKSEEVNFMVHEKDAGSDWKNCTSRDGLTMGASVRKMGGSPTVEELLKTADEIKRAALLVEKINSLDVVLEEVFKKN